MKWIGEVTPHSMARMTGAVYLLYFVTAILGEFFTRQAGISGIGNIPDDAAATARMLLANESAYRIGFAIDLISIGCYAALTALFYQLFNPVNRSVALIAVLLSFLALAVQASSSLFQLAPLVVLDGGPYLSGFSVEQLQGMALLFFKMSSQSGSIQLAFFAPFMLLLASLILKSTFLPRIFGVLIAIAGLGWLSFLWPPLAMSLLSYIEVVGFAAEALLMLWLLVMGINTERWNQQATATAAVSFGVH